MRDYKYVIVGGGVSAGSAAEAIRKRDPSGSLGIFTREWAPPYQRPPLSKEFLQGQAPLADALLFPAHWYPENNIDLHVGVSIDGLDPERRRLETAAGPVGYERLLLATGAVPRTLDIPGKDLAGVYSLRTYLDAEQLRGVRSSAQRVVLIGSGFIGMEVAASLRSGGCEVTVVTVDAALYERFGSDVSAYARTLFDRHGVETMLKTAVKSIAGDTRVSGVTLADGQVIEASAVVVGIGASPDTKLAEQAALNVKDGIIVDEHLQASDANVFAAGDVARFPGIKGKPVRVEHFDHAQMSGATAGANMAGAGDSYRYVPFFWSDVFELNFEFVGDPAPGAKVVLGTIDSGSFVVEYRDGDALSGALLAQRTPEERDAYRERLLPK